MYIYIYIHIILYIYFHQCVSVFLFSIFLCCSFFFRHVCLSVPQNPIRKFHLSRPRSHTTPEVLGGFFSTPLYWLVISTTPKSMKVSWDDYSQYMETLKKLQTTNQFIYLYKIRDTASASHGTDIRDSAGEARSDVPELDVLDTSALPCPLQCGWCGTCWRKWGFPWPWGCPQSYPSLDWIQPAIGVPPFTETPKSSTIHADKLSGLGVVTPCFSY